MPTYNCPFPILADERAFGVWFRNNLAFFGIREIIREDKASYPDVIVETINGQVLAVELEYDARNFSRHNHDASKCDLVIAYIRDRRTETVNGVPVLALLEAWGYKTLRDIMLGNVQPTAFAKLIMQTAADTLARRVD